jgi:hypothetical protein
LRTAARHAQQHNVPFTFSSSPTPLNFKEVPPTTKNAQFGHTALNSINGHLHCAEKKGLLLVPVRAGSLSASSATSRINHQVLGKLL